MITYQEALQCIADHTPHADTSVTTPVARLVCAENLSSPTDVPGFANSAMDGYAVRASDTNTGETTQLRVLGTITAGMATPENPAEAGTAWEIMTGAPVPEGYDAVIPVERTTQTNDFVEFNEAVPAGNNIRLAGEDFKQQDPLISAGTTLTAEMIMGLAAVGLDQLCCYLSPNVSIITTGDEISSKKADPAKGLIRDSNRPYLESVIARSDARLTGSHSVSDHPEQLRQQIESCAAESDIILTTGGVSAGRMDFVPAVLESMGAEILFHKVAIRPGKPILMAKLPDGTIVFGLPGNPIAVAVGWRFFVQEAIARMLGQNGATTITAVLENETRSKNGLRFFAKARYSTSDDGQLRVEVLPGQQSFKISPLMNANCWAVFEEDSETVAAGSTVKIAAL